MRSISAGLALDHPLGKAAADGGEVLKEVPESPQHHPETRHRGIWSMMGRPSADIMIIPAQPPRMGASAKAGSRAESFSRHSAT